jgi:hypothetical protein
MHFSPLLFLSTVFALVMPSMGKIYRFDEHDIFSMWCASTTSLTYGVLALIADLVVTSPNETSFIVAGSTLPITWTYSGVQSPFPPTISVELVDNISPSIVFFFL